MFALLLKVSCFSDGCKIVPLEFVSIYAISNSLTFMAVSMMPDLLYVDNLFDLPNISTVHSYEVYA